MYYCDTCDIKTNNKTVFNTHLLSAKHQRLCSENAKCKNYIHELISEGGGGGTVAESIPQKPPLNISDLSNPQKTPIKNIVQINLNEEDEQNNVIYNGSIKNDSDGDDSGDDGGGDSGSDDDSGSGDDGGHVTSSVPASSSAYECKYCKRPYINRTGLWRHNKKYGASCITKVVDASKIKNTAELKNVITTMMLMNHEFKTQILDLYKTSMTAITATTVAANSTNMTVAPTTINNSNTNNMTNCGNQMFNMQFFLNEQCKDAMNMKDFVNSIQLDMDDLETVGKLGYVEGMSNILITNLNKTELHKRPVHCSDIKRETLYVKDADKWECDGPDHAKMTNAVLAVEHKNVCLIGEWAALHPKCMNSNTNDNSRYFKLSKIVTDGAKDGNISKVIRRVAKNVLIDKMTPFVE
jgi:Zinc-finger of C2H2 type